MKPRSWTAPSFRAVFYLGLLTLDAARGGSSNYVCDVVPPTVPRELPAPEWPLCAPQFIIGGAEKSGTTSLYEYLKAHPDFLPLSGGYLLSRDERARMLATMGLVKERAMSKGKGKGTGIVFDEARWRQKAGGIHEHEVKSATPGKGGLLHWMPQHLEAYIAPIRVDKEVLYYLPSFAEIAEDLGMSNQAAYGRYVDTFPRIPAPNASIDGASPPQYLAGNLHKVTGEASPQYIDTGRYIAPWLLQDAPSTRLVFLLREPVRQFHSQAGMVSKMAARPIDPSFVNFEDCVQRCLGDRLDPNEQVHPTVRKPRVPGGGAAARSLQAKSTSGKEWASLRSEVEACFSHRLGQFLFKAIYAEALSRWLAFGAFPRDQLLVLASEELYATPVVAMRQVADFIGLKPIADDIWQDAARFRYSPHFHPGNISFSMRKTKVTAKDKGGAKASEDLKADTISESSDKLLSDFYMRPNCELRKLLGVDWSTWGWRYCVEDTSPAIKTTTAEGEADYQYDYPQARKDEL